MFGRVLLTAFQLLTDEVENEITLTAFRLLTLDLLVLYSVMNEGTINVLGTHCRLYVARYRLLMWNDQSIISRCRVQIANAH
jgi:hypothetical protein